MGLGFGVGVEMGRRVIGVWVVFVASAVAWGQQMPGTAGETLSGKPVVLAQAVRGHATVLVAGFSREAGDGTSAWVKALREDAAMAGVGVFQVAELEGAPGFVRGMIRSGMRKGVAAADQERFVVLTQDEKLWRSYFGVTTDKDPYVVLIRADGRVLWHGHGAAGGLEGLLREAFKAGA